MRSIMLLLLAAFAPAAMAGGTTTYSLVPASVAVGSEVGFRIDSSDGCFLAESHTVTRNGSQVEMRIVQTDQLPCLPSQMTPIIYSLGTFAAGVYEVSVVVCVNAPDPCSIRATLPLTVFGSDGVLFTVPTLSDALMIALAFAITVIGALMSRQPWRS